MKTKITILLLSMLPFISEAKQTLLQEDAYAVAWCLFTEARGEAREGLEAVASVILNRAKDRDLNLYDTVFQRKQFSGVGDSVPYWFSHGPESIRWPARYDGSRDLRAYRDCIKLGFKVAAGDFEPLGDWTHYFAHKICTPYWSDSMKEKNIIGNHTFGVAD